MKCKDIINKELPRERALNVGINNLTNNELICILLRCGMPEKNVIELSYEVLKLLDNFNDLNDLTINDLLKIKGIGQSKATTIMAAIEIGRRIHSSNMNKKKILSPYEIFNYFKDFMAPLNQEHLYVLYIDAKGHLIEKKLIGIGTSNHIIIDQKEIFKWAYKFKATALILVHNHPSGDPTPSIEDLKATKELERQAKLLNFLILDHIIIGNTYHSMGLENHLFASTDN